jgi:hypothetical protein
MQKSKITDRKESMKLKCVQELCHKCANGSLNYNLLQTTVIDGAGFGQPGTYHSSCIWSKGTLQQEFLNQALYDQAVFVGRQQNQLVSFTK